jgi:hypothetical protein
MPWIAALSIIERDPPADADAWLAAQAVREESLCSTNPDGGEVGATAAAMVLPRAGVSPSTFGLQPQDDDLLERFSACRPYRFTSSPAREEFLRWWAEHAHERNVP